VTLAAENCTNGVVDPGETVTLNIGLRNSGSANVTNLVQRCKPAVGWSLRVVPRLRRAAGRRGSRGPPFLALSPRVLAAARISLRSNCKDGANNLGTLSVPLTLGQLSGLSQNFDGVTAARAARWLEYFEHARWRRLGHQYYVERYTANSCFSARPPPQGWAISSRFDRGPCRFGAALVPHYYNMEDGFDAACWSSRSATAPSPILLLPAAVFVSGGYNGTLSSQYGNPLGGQSAWTGNAGKLHHDYCNIAGRGIPDRTYNSRWARGSDSSVA